MQLLNSPSTNPYESPRANRVAELRESRPDYAFWRVLLGLHLTVLIATVAFMISHEGMKLPDHLTSIIVIVVNIGALWIPGAPFFICYLVVAGCRGNKKYLLAAAAEILIWLAHIVAVFPAIQ